ncbi:6956_t:CDS:10, partial [Racocetra fulgida]
LMLNKIETVIEKNEIIKLAVKLIWNATDRNVSSITFKGDSSEIFCKDRSIIVDLGETDVVIIKGETYRKLIEKGTVSSEDTSSVDSEEIENVSGVQQSTTQHEQILANQSNSEIVNDNSAKNQLNDSQLYVSNIIDQETNVESSFEILEEYTNDIDKADFSQIDDGRDKQNNTLSTLQPSSIKENADTSLSNNNKNNQYDDQQSDEYADSTEEIDELRFDNILISKLRKRNSDKQNKINELFKASKTIKSKVNKVSNEPVNDFIERVPSDLTDEDSLTSIREILKPSVTQNNHPSKETNLPHPNTINAETSVAESNRNVNEYPVTSSREKSNDIVILYKRNPARKKNQSNINNEHVDINQETNEIELQSDHSIHVRSPDSTEAVTVSKIESNKTNNRYPESKLLKSFASQDPSKIFEMFSQHINRYFNKVSEVSIEPEPFPKIMEDVQSCSEYLKS